MTYFLSVNIFTLLSGKNEKGSEKLTLTTAKIRLIRVNPLFKKGGKAQ